MVSQRLLPSNQGNLRRFLSNATLVRKEYVEATEKSSLDETRQRLVLPV